MNTRKPMQVLMPDLPEYFEKGEFLLRELDLIGKKINHEEESPLPSNSMLYCNNLSHWEKRLSLSEKSSVSVIIATNEYYEKDKWMAVNKFESIKCAFIQYLPNSHRTRFGSTIKFIFLNIHFLRDKAFWQTIKSASRTYKDMRSQKFRIPVFNFPLGYTDRFAKELKNLGLLPKNYNSLFANEIYDNNSRKADISFVGQKGRWYRRLMVDYFEEKAGARTNKYGSFGGFTDLPETTNYAKSILASRFVVCPPGNVSSQSFRYYEAIALGAIPIVTEVSIQDWNTHNYWPKNVAWKNANFIDIWLSLKKMNSESLDELRINLRASVLEQLQITKKLIRASVEGQNVWIREDSND
jgi:hypothetical protein